MPKIWKKEFAGKTYSLTQNGIFEGYARKKKAKEHAAAMREIGCSTRTEHKEKQSVVWIKCIK